MNAQDVILGSRVIHIRELKAEIEKLRSENARLRDENAGLLSHFDLALLAAVDLRTLPEGGRLVVVDGWNMILGAGKTARNPAELESRYREHLASHPADLVWIVYDGPREAVKTDGRLRLSWTGGTGPHRADRFICDFLRMARFRGDVSKIEVVTCDRDFLKTVRRIASC
ncbi:MAG: hypothetical protein K6F50_02285 [Kiritimatiellae bacterium]|nr:hypothetical protein [Kiritimatiellia bacterium]